MKWSRIAFWIFVIAVVVFLGLVGINIAALLLGPGFDP